MPRLAMKKPCAECPFRKNAPAGYLGPWDTHGIMGQAFSEAGLMCHSTIPEDASRTAIARLTKEGKIKICAGSLMCANKSAKLYRDPELHAAQLALKLVNDSNIMDRPEFMEHHESFKLRRTE